MPTLTLRFLGPMELHWDDQPLPKPATRKAQSLLAYLVMHRGRPQPRDQLMDLFWGERPERKARQSLATALWRIRHCLPQDLIHSDHHTVQFDPPAAVGLWLDVAALERRAASDDIADLQAAVELYHGDLLAGFYDEWVITERYRLQTLFLETLARLMVGQEARDEHQAALTTALRLLAHDPLREDAHCLAMRAHCRLGQRHAALEQYRRCREILQQELGVEPMVETAELYRAIRAGRFPVGPVSKVVTVPVPAAVPTGRSPLDVVPPGPLVGRERELTFLRQLWSAALAGQGGLVLIHGEAGVGKTRLVQEFADQVRWQSARVLWGRCYEFERVLPYQPLAEALRAASLASLDLADVPADTIAEVARLVPELLVQRPGLEAPETLPPDQERARLFGAVARLLAVLAMGQPLLVVLEDLHWATESTLQLLHYLARHLAGCPALLAGTFRTEAAGPDHPLLTLQRQLSREGLARSLDLPRLSAEAVADLVREMSGARAAAVAPLARRLYQETEGNPFFLMEIVKALFETGLVHLEGGVWRGDLGRVSQEELPLPPGLSAAIQARAGRLGDDVQEVLRLAAVLGREFDFDLLAAAWGRGEEATLAALDDLLRRRLIDEGTGPLGRDYVFTHHKIQEVVYAGIARRRRQHLHARVGVAMENVYDTEAVAFPPGSASGTVAAGELAFHFQQARQIDQTLTAKAVTYLLQAGDQARLAYACQEASGYYQRALSLLEEQGEQEQAARTLMKLGLTYDLAFDFRRSRQAYEQGFALWQRAREVDWDDLPPVPHPLRLRAGGPNTLDPTRTDYEISTRMMCQLFSGLVELRPDMGIVPDVARSWEVLEGGSRYLFHLRDDVRWSDGTPVTAGDFEYGWKRVLDPVYGMDVARLLYDVKGARAFHQGEVSEPDRVGVKALNEVTLAVELEGPTGHFLQLLAQSATFPVPRHVVERHGEAWAEPENIVTCGPFRLESWQPGERMTLARNPDYHGRFTGNLECVELSLRGMRSLPSGEMLEMYEDDRLDVVHITSSEVDRVRQRYAGEYHRFPELATTYLQFDASRPPFADIRVRRAFVMATDREALVGAVAPDSFPATGGFVPPGMPGHLPGIGLPHDPAQARQLLAEAGYPGGQGFPVVECLTTPRMADRGENLRAQWRENLGIEIVWKIIDWPVLIDRLSERAPHLLITGWIADYPEPDDFLRARVGQIQKESGWRNEYYDNLVAQAQRSLDQGERMRLYGAAERILVEEAPIMPLMHPARRLLVKRWVTRYPTTGMREWFFKDVIIEPH